MTSLWKIWLVLAIIFFISCRQGALCIFGIRMSTFHLGPLEHCLHFNYNFVDINVQDFLSLFKELNDDNLLMAKWPDCRHFFLNVAHWWLNKVCFSSFFLWPYPCLTQNWWTISNKRHSWSIVPIAACKGNELLPPPPLTLFLSQYILMLMVGRRHILKPQSLK